MPARPNDRPEGPARAADTPAQRAQRDRRFRLFILVVGSLVTLGMVYGSGMRTQKKALQNLDEKRKLIAQDLRQQQRSSRLRLAAAQQLEARRQVSVALSELDRRNFGTAQERVNEAARLLDEADKANSSNPDLSGVRDALKGLTLTAAADLAGPRESLLGIATEMDRAFDGYTGEFLSASAADDAAHPIQNPTMNDVPNPAAVGRSVMPGR